jgi:zinc protease
MDRIVPLFLVLTTLVFGADYAIVTSETVMADPDWIEVVDSLTTRHDATVYTYLDSLFEVQSALSAEMPRYVCFVVAPMDIITYPFGGGMFVRHCHEMMRSLDDDPFTDALFGIVTGYDADDALRLAAVPDSIRVKTVLSGTSSAWLSQTYQGVSSAENVYGLRWFKYPDGSIVSDSSGPDDRTEWLVDHLNSDTVDLFITSGHANFTEWQLHYPDVGLEGFFRSSEGQVYGDAHTGDTFNISSGNPKIYFGVGNCRIGKINSLNCMVLAWIHTGGACQYTGYTVDTWYGYGTGGIPFYFHQLQDRFTWPEAYFSNYQCLVYDEINGTPGTDSSGLAYDRNVVALYGDPALDIRKFPEPNREALYDQTLEIVPGGGTRDTFKFTITINDSCNPGFTGAWGNRHPIAFLPERIGNGSVEIVSHDGHGVAVTDNFVLFHIWNQGDPPLEPGETRELIFTAKSTNDVEEELSRPITEPDLAIELSQNPAKGDIDFIIRSGIPLGGIPVTLILYDASGRLVRKFRAETRGAESCFHWDGRDGSGRLVRTGVYFFRVRAGARTSSGRFLRV